MSSDEREELAWDIQSIRDNGGNVESKENLHVYNPLTEKGRRRITARFNKLVERSKDDVHTEPEEIILYRWLQHRNKNYEEQYKNSSYRSKASILT